MYCLRKSSSGCEREVPISRFASVCFLWPPMIFWSLYLGSAMSCPSLRPMTAASMLSRVSSEVITKLSRRAHASSSPFK